MCARVRGQIKLPATVYTSLFYESRCNIPPGQDVSGSVYLLSPTSSRAPLLSLVQSNDKFGSAVYTAAVINSSSDFPFSTPTPSNASTPVLTVNFTPSPGFRESLSTIAPENLRGYSGEWEKFSPDEILVLIFTFFPFIARV